MGWKQHWILTEPKGLMQKIIIILDPTIIKLIEKNECNDNVNLQDNYNNPLPNPVLD